MKKIILSLLTAIIFVACAEKDAYTISGEVNNLTDGTEVYLSEDRRGKKVLESVKVENGKFTFTKRKLTAGEDIVFVGVDGLERNGSPSRPMPIFVEAGEISVLIDEKGVWTISGTPLNESHTKFWSSLGENKAPDSETVKEYIKTNADNIVGVYYFEKMLYAYSLEEAKEALSLFPAKFDNNKSLGLIRENVKTREETAAGKKFKDLKGLSPDSVELALSDYVGKNKIVLVDFWASWCPPCREDMPFLVDAYAKYKDKGFEIVGVSLDSSNKDWKDGIEKLNITWPQMSDLKQWESDLAKAYAVRSIPATVLIDAEGNIIAKGVEGKDLDTKLAELLGK